MDKYLLEILTESNTIIIPGLGALTITNKDTGETMFMPYLQHDDGKLAEFISAKDGIELADAKIMVAKYVREIQAQVDKGESYDMFQLGTFVKAADGDIEFAHWTGGAKSAPVIEDTTVIEEVVEPEVAVEPEIQVTEEPKIETLEEPVVLVEEQEEVIIEEEIIETSIEEEPSGMSEAIAAITPMVESHSATEITVEIVPEPITESIADDLDTIDEIPELVIPIVDPVTDKVSVKTPKEIKSKKSKVPSVNGEKKKRGVGFWILIVLLVGLVGGGVYFGMNYDELKQHIPFLADKKEVVKESSAAKKEMEEMLNGPETEESSEAEELVEEPIVEEKVVEKPAPKPEPVKTPNAVASSGGAYHIVSGAFSSIDNANRLMESFKAQGLPARIIQNNGLNVVCMQSYATSAQAQADLSNMKSKASSCWILYKP